MAIIGEILLLAGAAAWVTGWEYTGWGFALGAGLFAIGRIAGENGDAAKSNDESLVFNLRRLYRQRMIGAIMTILAAILMNLKPGFLAFGIYLQKTTWLIPFIVFVVIETYTAFRIPAVESKIQNK